MPPVELHLSMGEKNVVKSRECFQRSSIPNMSAAAQSLCLQASERGEICP